MNKRMRRGKDREEQQRRIQKIKKIRNTEVERREKEEEGREQGEGCELLQKEYERVHEEGRKTKEERIRKKNTGSHDRTREVQFFTF